MKRNHRTKKAIISGDCILPQITKVFQIEGGQMKEKGLNEFAIRYLWASAQLVRVGQHTGDPVGCFQAEHPSGVA